jgi:hypothetical protein
LFSHGLNVAGFCLLPMQVCVAHQFSAGHFDSSVASGAAMFKKESV